MADFNQLAAEAIPLSEAFAQQLGEALDFIESIRKDASNAQEKAESKTADLKKAIDALESFFQKAQSEIVGARESAVTKLNAVETKAGTVKTKVEALSAAVKKGATDVETKKTQVEEAIKKSMDTAREDFDGRRQELEELQGTLQSNLAEAVTSLNKFRNAVLEGQAELDKKMLEWQGGVDTLSITAAREADDWVDGLQVLMETAVAAMFTAGNDIIQVHNMTMSNVKAMCIDEATEDLDESMKPLEEQLGNLAELAEKHKTGLPNKAKEIVAKIQGLVSRIETVKTAMQAADRL